jgi:fatty-acyl-CoA synthase
MNKAHAAGGEATPWVDGLTLGQALRETARRFPKNDACVFCDPQLRMTWAQFDATVDQASRGLLAMGFAPGHHFGVWATNVPQWLLLQFATARIGVVLVNINPAYRTSELKYALRQSDVRGLALINAFKTSNYLAMMSEACSELASMIPGELQSETFPKLKWLVSLRGDTPAGMISWDGLLAKAASVPQQRVEGITAQLSPHDPINIQYTSGTTGNPKGAMLSHRNILLNGYYAGDRQRFTEKDRVCLPVPLYHCFGCVLGTLACMAHGSAMIFPAESFNPAATLAAIEQEKCTALYGVPTMFIAQLEHEDYRKRDLSSLRTGIMSGSPCPVETMKRVTHEMGAREITCGYGQTEMSPLMTQTCTDDPIELRVGTVGRPLPGVEVKIVDVETGEDLPDEKAGEICGRGHGKMIGYYNMPEKTAEAIDPAGWLHTGDLGVREPSGYYRITGRLRDMIIRGGENIYPREIEERLYEHPSIAEVQVVGVPDRRLGEEVLAWVKFKCGHRATEDELRDFCRQTLAHFKTPRYWKFVDCFPTTVTGKIQKFKIREQAIEDLGLKDVANIETA